MQVSGSTRLTIHYSNYLSDDNNNKLDEKKNPQIIEEKIRNIKRTNSMDNANTF